MSGDSSVSRRINSSSPNRRDFVKSGAVSQVAAAIIARAAPTRAASANDEIRVGLIGYGLGVLGTVLFILGFSGNPTFKGFYIPWPIPLITVSPGYQG